MGAQLRTNPPQTPRYHTVLWCARVLRDVLNSGQMIATPVSRTAVRLIGVLFIYFILGLGSSPIRKNYNDQACSRPRERRLSATIWAGLRRSLEPLAHHSTEWYRGVWGGPQLVPHNARVNFFFPVRRRVKTNGQCLLVFFVVFFARFVFFCFFFACFFCFFLISAWTLFKRNSAWFKINRKTVNMTIFRSIWK